jgi:hypothetical protein
MLKFYSIALLVLLLSVLSSCRKDPPPDPPPGKSYEVITTGTLFNPTTQAYEPHYWVNEKLFSLAMGGAQEAFPYGMVKTGTDLYITGTYTGLHPQYGYPVILPCYWKNGQKYDLPANGLDFDERCSAIDIKWLNGALYLLGDADLKPVIWKIKQGAVSLIPVPLTPGTVDARRGANLEVYNNQLYFAGNEKKEKDGKMIFSSGYWTVDAADKIGFSVLEDNLAYALCFGLSVSSKGLYITGEYATAPGIEKPVIWTLQGHLPVADQLNPSTQLLNESVIDAHGTIYLNILDIQPYQPLIWK